MKTLRLILSIVSILSACLLWITRTEWQPSLSAFALSENALYYRAMHVSAALFLVLGKKRFDKYIAFGMALILGFDMYHYPILHNLITVITLILACFSLIYLNKGFYRNVMIFLSFSAIIVFVLGYFVSSFHLLFAEIISIGCIMNGKLIENYEET